MNVASKTEDTVAVEIAEVRRGPVQEPGRAVETRIYEYQIPDFVSAELDRLYETVYCTLTRLQIYGEAHAANTYVARSHGQVICLILFRVEGSVVKVINQQIALSADDLRTFSDAIFARYRAVRLITFYAIDTAISRFNRPFQKYEVLEENVLKLPATCDAYMASLSQTLLKRIQSGERKLKRDHPNFHFQVLSGKQVSEQTLRQVVALTEARMAAKQQSAYIAEDDIGKILRLIHAYGYVGVLTIDGVMRGGNIFYGVGTRYFMHVIAHDPAYDKYMLGHTVQYLAACFCIERKGRECCLMGGGRENKERFRAYPKYFDNVDIYRSRLAFLLSVRRVWAGSTRRLAHRTRQDFLELAQADSRAGRAAARCLEGLRSVKRLWRGAASEPK